MARRAAITFVLHLLLTIAGVLVVAVIWAVLHGGTFANSFAVGCYAIGAFVLVMGALGVGGMSPSSGLIETSGRIPGLKAYTQVSPGANSVSMTAILLLVGCVLIGIGILLQVA
jgi:hypothetical protein